MRWDNFHLVSASRTHRGDVCWDSALKQCSWSGRRDVVVISADRLTKSYGEGALRQAVLREVSFELGPAQLTLLVGPSGSGKTTLLAALSGLVRPDGGEVRLLGKSIWAADEAAREAFRRDHCGFIFQSYNL